MLTSVKNFVFGESTLKHYCSLLRPPEGTSLHEPASYKPLCTEIGPVIFAVGNNKNKKERERKKERKGTKSHKVIIFHIFIENHPVNGILSKFCIAIGMVDNFVTILVPKN